MIGHYLSVGRKPVLSFLNTFQCLVGYLICYGSLRIDPPWIYFFLEEIAGCGDAMFQRDSADLDVISFVDHLGFVRPMLMDMHGIRQTDLGSIKHGI